MAAERYGPRASPAPPIGDAPGNDEPVIHYEGRSAADRQMLTLPDK